MYFERDKWARYLQAAAIAFIAAAVVTAALTIAGEKIPALKEWLKATFTHHWLGKSVIAIAVFVLVALWQEQTGSGTKATDAIRVAAAMAPLSAAAMVSFFFLHVLGIV